jgi:phage repressor protein C with HTH and peptisase S24 domain
MNSEIYQSEFIARLTKLMGDEKPYPWAKRIGLSAATFTRIWKEGVVPKGDVLALISEKTGCSLDWLVTGIGSMLRSAHVSIAADQSPHYASSEELAEHYVLVPHYEVAASAGGGAVIHSEQIVDYLSFKAEWVRNGLGLSVQDLALINVQGDSMEPTLSNNDLILIDTRTHQVQNNAIYVLQFNGALLVKRIQRRLDGTVIVKGDNPVYEPEVLLGDASTQLNVIGRVVWCGRRM